MERGRWRSRRGEARVERECELGKEALSVRHEGQGRVSDHNTESSGGCKALESLRREKDFTWEAHARWGRDWGRVPVFVLGVADIILSHQRNRVVESRE